MIENPRISASGLVNIVGISKKNRRKYFQTQNKRFIRACWRRKWRVLESKNVIRYK